MQTLIKNVTNPEELELQKMLLQRRHSEEIKQTDMELIKQLDQKVEDTLIFMIIITYDIS